MTPDDVAVLTYTSGTTGSPKGAMNLHRNMVHGMSVYRDGFAIGTGDIALGIAPLFHITGLVAGLGVTIGCGIPLVLLHRFEPKATVAAIERWRTTFTVGDSVHRARCAAGSAR